MVMDARILLRVTFFLLFVYFISDTTTGVKPPVEAIRESIKLDYQENQMFFSPLTGTTQRDTAPGNVPIVNPTIPGTTPIVNPTNPSPPTPVGSTSPTPPTPVGSTSPTPPMGGATSPSPPTEGSTSPSPPTMAGPNNPTPPTSGGGGGRGGGGGGGGGGWCIAKPSASETALQVALDYACGYGGADCSAIQPNGACYNPDTVHDHASYAFNEYYQKNPAPTSCDFGGAAQLTNTDPSTGNCRYASSTSSPTTTTPPSTPTTAPTIPMTPPSTNMPAGPYPPGGNGFGSEPAGYDYGAEPTGTPNSVETMSLNLLLLITMNCIIMSATVATNF